MHGTDAWSLSFADGYRAVFRVGVEVVPGHVHIVWEFIGTHAEYDREYRVAVAAAALAARLPTETNAPTHPPPASRPSGDAVRLPLRGARRDGLATNKSPRRRDRGPVPTSRLRVRSPVRHLRGPDARCRQRASRA
jgi:hypothetical protein